MIQALLHPNSLIFLITAAGMFLSRRMYHQTRARERLFREAGKYSGIPQINVTRTYRVEICYGYIHFALFLIAAAVVWRELSAVSFGPDWYEIGITILLVSISAVLLGQTLLDLRDARRVAKLLDLPEPEGNGRRNGNGKPKP